MPRKRIHEDPAARVRAFREQQRDVRKRMEIALPSDARWRLEDLSMAWRCSRSQAIERLIIEADERYREILYPGIGPDHKR